MGHTHYKLGRIKINNIISHEQDDSVNLKLIAILFMKY